MDLAKLFATMHEAEPRRDQRRLVEAEASHQALPTPPAGVAFDAGRLRRRWQLIATIGAAATVAAVALSLAQPRRYTATTAVVVGSGADLTQTVEINMATEKQIAGSTAVASKVAAFVGFGADPEQLLTNLVVDVPVDTNVLRFTYAETSPYAAVRLADAFADAYLDFRHRSVLNGIEAATELIDKRIDELTRRLSDVAEKSHATTDPGRRAGLNAEYDSIIAEVTTLEQRLATSTSAGIVAGRVIAPAIASDDPLVPPYVLNGVFGAFAGVVLGLGIALAFEGLGRRVRGPVDVEAIAGAPVLAELEMPRFRASSRNGHGPRSATSERAVTGFRKLRTRLLIALDRLEDQGAGERTVAIVGTTGVSDAAYVTLNLASAIAATGRRVIVVSPSGDAPIEEMLRLDDVDGPVRATPDVDDVRPTAIADLDAITVTTDEDDLAALDVERAARTVGLAASLANVVLVAAPALDHGGDGGALLAACRRTILVTRAGASRADIARARAALDDLDSSVLGVALLNARSRARLAREEAPSGRGRLRLGRVGSTRTRTPAEGPTSGPWWEEAKPPEERRWRVG
jgi:capsular polysaccharide biosynthesis protein